MGSNEFIGKIEIERAVISHQIKKLENSRMLTVAERETYIKQNNEEMVGILSQDIYTLDSQIDSLYDEMSTLKRQIKAVL